MKIKKYLKVKDEIQILDFYKIWETIFIFDIASEKNMEICILSNQNSEIIESSIKLYREKVIETSKKDSFYTTEKDINKLKNNSCDLIIGNSKQIIEDENFISRFIVPIDSPIKSLKDLKGKTFAFGSPSSTSGHLMPRFFLMQAGIQADTDLKNIAFSGAHDATVAFVASGKVEAGVLNASVLDKLIETNNANALKVRVLATTPTYYDYNWTVRGDLDPALVKKISNAFLKLDSKNPVHKELMELQRASKYITTKVANYDGIEQAARSAGLIK